jgi:imidazolonepropionase-like amidohydrolase
VRAPAGARTIDTTGRWLIPGLIDCHVHFTGDHVEVAIENGKRIEMQPTMHRKYMEPIHSVRTIRAAANANIVLAAGFTTVRNLGHGDPAQIAAVQYAIRHGILAGPDVLSAGWSLSQTGGHGKTAIWPYELAEQLRPRSSFADGVVECAEHVRQNVREGAECIKIYTTEGIINAPDHLEGIPNFSVAEIRAMTDAAHEFGVRVASHTTALDGTRNAVLGGVDTIEHGPHEIDEKLIELMRRSKTVLVPTLSVFDFAARGRQDHIFPKWVGERAKRWLEGRSAFVCAAKQAGVTIAVGSDSGAPPRGGNNAHELELLVRAGLSPLEAIQAATQGSAIAIGREPSIGTIQKGRRADILVVAKDPVANVSVLVDHANISEIVQPRLGELS